MSLFSTRVSNWLFAMPVAMLARKESCLLPIGCPMSFTEWYSAIKHMKWLALIPFFE
jgi:hypothetical protein